ncbi:hypothetical protein BDF19DRAFT_80921 [Syncephalis fuscata]|nr:hypothetical protein BDF19DRAFT_80921 [Syncephalis fuscata]
MRFCNRCGDPVSGPRCKCGGTPKEAEGSGGGEGVTTLRRDVWSRKYLTKGLDQPVVGRPRSSSVSDPSTPKCPDCGLRLSPTVDGGMACRVCILKPSSKGICAACEKPVIPLAVPGQTATWVEYGTKPCCEDCLMAQAGARTPMDEVTLETATSVPPSTYNNNSRQQSSALSDGSTLIKSTESLVEDKSPKNPTSAFSVTNNVTGATPVTVAAVTAVTAIPKEASLVPEKKKAISSPKASPKIGPSEFECSACKLPITDAGVRLPSGRLYHPHCFTCAECGKEFKQSAFVNYGGRAYHPDCTPKANVERCNDCGKLISGFYVKNNGASYHAEVILLMRI